MGQNLHFKHKGCMKVWRSPEVAGRVAAKGGPWVQILARQADGGPLLSGLNFIVLKTKNK